MLEFWAFLAIAQNKWVWFHSGFMMTCPIFYDDLTHLFFVWWPVPLFFFFCMVTCPIDFLYGDLPHLLTHLFFVWIDDQPHLFFTKFKLPGKTWWWWDGGQVWWGGVTGVEGVVGVEHTGDPKSSSSVDRGTLTLGGMPWLLLDDVCRWLDGLIPGDLREKST